MTSFSGPFKVLPEIIDHSYKGKNVSSTRNSVITKKTQKPIEYSQNSCRLHGPEDLKILPVRPIFWRPLADKSALLAFLANVFCFVNEMWIIDADTTCRWLIAGCKK